MASFVYVMGRLIYFYELVICIWAICSFIPTRPGSVFDDVKAVLDRVTLPFINLFRRFIPPMGGLDFSPVVAILVLTLLQRGLTTILL